MEKSDKKKSGLSALIAAGKGAAQELEGRTTTDTKEEFKDAPLVPEKKESNEFIFQKNNEISKDQESFQRFLNKRENKELHEMVRFPQTIHKRLKLLSVATNIPLYVIIANIVEETLDINEKAIDKIIKQAI